MSDFRARKVGMSAVLGLPRHGVERSASGTPLWYRGRMSNPDRELGEKGRDLGEQSVTETLLWGDRANKPLTSVRRFRLMVVEGRKRA
jgi:hypothetical protein